MTYVVTHPTLGVSSLNACLGSAFELPVVVVESARIWLPLSPQVEPFFFLLSKAMAQRASVKCIGREILSICSTHKCPVLLIEDVHPQAEKLNTDFLGLPSQNPYTKSPKHMKNALSQFLR